MSTAPPPAPQTKEISVSRLATTVFSVMALMVAMAALAVSANNNADRVQAGVVDTADAVPVSLTEFAFTPKVVTVEEGGALQVTNNGAAPHLLEVVGKNLTTPTLDAGGSTGLSMGGLKLGTYEIACTIPGHQEAGMKGELHVVAAGEGTGNGSHGAHMSADAMDELMAERIHAFPAETKGLGAQLLEPTILPDGTKQFELTTSEIDWEIEPGKTVKAMAYNGMVPGPTIKLDHGDNLRVVLHNQMAESTAIHFHGLITPNSMDGVPDITQPPVKPGESFVYEFPAIGPAVGMYHSHHNAHIQVPNGLAGAIIIGGLPLPAGVNVTQEIPMMLNDAGTIGMSLNGKSFPATAPIATKQGEWILVHYLNEGVMAHPMHLHGMFQLVIAKDGVPLSTPYYADTINVSPGERYSVLVHAEFPGVWAWHCHILPHAERDDGMFGMVTALIVE